MACRRCHGLMVVDHFIDMLDDRGHLWLRAWRCVNCGDVEEPGIALNQRAQQSLLGRLAGRWAMSHRKLDPIALGV